MKPVPSHVSFGKFSLLRSPLRVLSGFSLLGLFLLLAPQLFADSQRLIPAGSLVSCTTGDARISSKTTAPGDPVLCKVEHRRGDFMLPYGSYLGGEFSEYKDPGHFVGKGWMQLSFDRMYVGDTVVPIDAKVVNVPGYKIDAQGRILGKGHAVRDTVEWMIPVLWPIKLINLPRRGPRPTLKAETALTLRVMEDIVVPSTPEPQRDPYGLIPRGQGANDAPPPPTEDQQPAPQMSYDQQPAPQYEPPPPPYYAPAPPPPVIAYAVPVPPPYFIAPPPVVMAYGAGFFVGPPVAYGYGPSFYAGRPFVGYAPRAYGYGGYAGRGFAAGGRVGVGYRGGFRGR